MEGAPGALSGWPVWGHAGMRMQLPATVSSRDVIVASEPVAARLVSSTVRNRSIGPPYSMNARVRFCSSRKVAGSVSAMQ
jgi:hypothetical protein